MLIASPGYLAQVVNRKRSGGTGTHVKVGNTKIDGVCSRLNSCRKRFAGTDRSHYFKVFNRVIHTVINKL